MRFRHPDGTVVHLAYGSNVHPAETVDGIVEQLRRYGGGVRASLDADLLGVGLWLPAGRAGEKPPALPIEGRAEIRHQRTFRHGQGVAGNDLSLGIELGDVNACNTF